MFSLSKRILILILFGVLALGIYKGTQFLVLNYIGISTVDLRLPGEEQIPFVPFIFLFYMVAYFMTSWVILKIRRKGRMLKVLTAFFIALGIHFLFFVFIPVEYVLRPEVKVGSYIFTELIAAFFNLDAPINTFPSMHVSFAFLSYFIVRRYWPAWSGTFLILAIVTSLSTVFVKQHYILDGVAAFLLALAINYLFINRRFGKWAKSPANLG